MLAIRLVRVVLFALVCVGAALRIKHTSSVVTLALFGAGATCALLLAKELLELFVQLWDFQRLVALLKKAIVLLKWIFSLQRIAGALGKLALATASCFVALLAFECALKLESWWHGGRSHHDATARRLTMPKEWERCDADIEGAVQSYWWHDKL